jgi:valyl-tRNA synthetase
VPPRYRGLERFEARKAVVADLEAGGFLVKVEDYKLIVGHCQRSGVIVEPTVSLQWYVRTQPLAEAAMKAVRDGRTVFVPAAWEKTYMQWLENIRDWCISRQLWWGHRIPVWYCRTRGCDGMHVDEADPKPDTRCPKCGAREWRQDDDVLDTWFSSALWPFSTLGWPDDTKALRTFYPTTVMETGFDIIFFWVARMMMMGLHFMDDVPFRTVYLHAMVRDEHGSKMSKTKGNVIDPLDLVDEVGADALRFTLVTMAAQGRDVKLSVDRVKGYREFVNKLWNAARFAFMNLDDFQGPPRLDGDLSFADRWILTRLKDAMAATQRALTEYRFNDAANGLYQFTWRQFCDWYLELAKGALAEGGERRRTTQSVLVTVLDAILRSLHPIMPFVTEEVWQKLRPFLGDAAPSLCVAAFPTGEGVPAFPEDAATMDEVLDVIGSIRGVRSQVLVPPSEAVDVVVKPRDASVGSRLADHSADIARLGRVRDLRFDGAASRPAGAAVAVGANADCYVVVGDERLAAEKKRLAREIEKARKDLDQVRRKLGNEQFLAKAAEDVVEAEREKEAALSATLARAEDALGALG